MDNSLEFWFRLLTPNSPPMGRIICMAEADNVYHVETRFHGKFFSADPTDGVRFVDQVEHQDSPSGFWDVLRVPDQVTPAIDDWAESIVGERYDFFGAFNSAMGIPLRDPYRWFCSLVAEEIAKQAGIDGLDPLPSPSTLRKQLWSHVGLVTASPTATFPVAGLKLGDNDLAFIQELVSRRAIDAETAEKVIAACGRAA